MGPSLLVDLVLVELEASEVPRRTALPPHPVGDLGRVMVRLPRRDLIEQPVT